MPSEEQRAQNHAQYQRQLIKESGASNQVTGPKITADPAKAGRDRCPKTRTVHGPNSDVFRKVMIRAKS